MFRYCAVLFLSLLMCAQSAQAAQYGRPIVVNDILSYGQVSRNAWRVISPMDIGGNKDFSVQEIREEMAKNPGKMVGKVLGMPSHASQTIVQIFIITVIQQLMQNSKMNKIMAQPDQNKGWWELIVNSGYDLVNNFELYSSIIGAGVVGGALHKPLKAIMDNLVNAGMRAEFVEHIKSTAFMFVTFIGWEFGAQLWKEAIYAIADEKNNLKAEDEMAMALSLNFDKIFLKKASAEELRVFTKVVDNMLLMFLFKKPEMMRNLIENTWRLRIQTGHFTTLFISMWFGAKVFGAGCTAIAPGVGTFGCGFLGGLAGGLGTLLIPHSWNDTITAGYRFVRLRNAYNRLDANNAEILRIAALYEQGKGTRDPEKQYQMLKKVFDRRQAYRNDALTNLFEQYSDAINRRKAAEELLLLLSKYQQLDRNKVAFTKTPSDFYQHLDADQSIRYYKVETFEDLVRIKKEEEKHRDDAIKEIAQIEDALVDFYYTEVVVRLGALEYNPAIKGKFKEVVVEEGVILDKVDKNIRLTIAGQTPEKVKKFGLDGLINVNNYKVLAMSSERFIIATQMRRYHEANLILIQKAVEEELKRLEEKKRQREQQQMQQPSICIDNLTLVGEVSSASTPN